MPIAGPELTSIHNPHVKFARSLQARKHRQQERAFIVEGERLFLDAIDAGATPLRVFVDIERVHLGVRDALETLPQNVPIHPCNESVVKTIADTQTPQGIVAIFPFPTVAPIDGDTTPLFVIADGIKDPGNLGTLMRSALAAGVLAIFTSPETVDPFSPKAVRSGMGAHFRLSLSSLDWLTPPAELVQCQQKVIAEASALVSYDKLDWTVPAVLIVGSETGGISADARRFATSSAAIPLQGHVESLNAAVAGAVILFEVARQRRTQ